MKRIIRKLFRKMLGFSVEIHLEDLKLRGLKVGENFSMLDGCIIDDSHCWHIEIGDNVTLAPGVHILAHDASTKMHTGYTKIKNVSIGNKVFIGALSIILPGVRIGDNVIIGAGSVVTGNVPDNSVYAGNPASLICTTEDYLVKIGNQMNDRNKFGEEYTLRASIDEKRKSDMKEIISAEGVGFVV
jgi:maltose O-acetyltransferase